MADPSAYIWIRSTVDWADADAVDAQLSRSFRPKVELWNETFAMPFHRFRHRVREIAAASLGTVADAEIAEWAAIPNGALVLPVDDDDWFRPDVAQQLASQRGRDVAGYRWPSRWLEVPIDRGHQLHRVRRRLAPWTQPKWLCTTNNYAMTKCEDHRDALIHHTFASRRFERCRAEPSCTIAELGQALSVANRTLASQTSLGWNDDAFGRAELVSKAGRYRRLYRRRLSADLRWAAPYVAMMAELMDELELG